MIEAILLSLVLNAPCPPDTPCVGMDDECVTQRQPARRTVKATVKVAVAPVRLMNRIVHRVRSRERFRPLRRIIERRRSGHRLRG